jgi:O-antigen ligase
VQALSLTTLLAAIVVAAVALARRRILRVPLPLGVVVALFTLSAAQLLPLPPGFHAVIAPGSAAFWHPDDSVAAAVLGPAAHPLSIDPEDTRRSLAFALGLVVLVALARPSLTDPRVARAAVATLVGGGLAVGLYGIVARAFFGPLLFGRIAVPTVSPFGPFVSKNHFAGYVEMATLLAIGLALGLADEARRGGSALGWVERPGGGWVIVASGAAAVMALAVLASLSRGGVLSLGVGLIVLVALRWTARRRRPSAGKGRLAGMLAGAALAVGIALAVLPAEGRDRIATLGGVAGEASGTFRLGIWRDTLDLALRSPLAGFGLGTFAAALPPHKTSAGELRVEHAENDYLELLAEMGGLGLILAAGAMAAAGYLLFRDVGRPQDRLRRGLGMGAAAALVALGVHGAFDFNLHIPSNSLLFAFAAALALASTGGPERRLGPPALVVAIVALSVLGASVARPLPRGIAEQAQVRAVVSGARSPLRLRAAEDEVVSWLRGRPADAEAWLFLAWIRGERGKADEAAALARHAVALDPRRAQLAREAARLGAPRSN